MVLRASAVGHVYAQGTSWAQEALDSIDMRLDPGRLALIAGPTGSGKSTLLRILGGMLEPTAGQVSIDGTAPVPAGEDPASRVGLMFQRAESQLFAESVMDDVAFGPSNLGVPPDEAVGIARAALASVGMDPDTFGARSPFGLSGGEARRVALAGVLAIEPRYMLLDEPTAGLDAQGRDAVRKAVDGSRAERGIAIVTHDLEEYLDIADDIILLSAGTLAFAGTVPEFLEACVAGEISPPAIVSLQIEAMGSGAYDGPLHVGAQAVAAALGANGGWGR